MPKLNSYILLRDRPKKHTTILNYGNQHELAMKHYSVFELAEFDCLMVGADSIDTLRQTHSNWFLKTDTATAGDYFGKGLKELRKSGRRITSAEIFETAL